jgi:hypothetical protein
MSIRSRLEDRPWYALTAHFFVGLFDFGVLSDAGSDAFQRVLIGIIAILLTFGLLLARMFVIPGEGPSAAARYRLAVVAVEALMIGLPMLVVAFAALLVSHALFPDETDFRILLVLPVSRRTVFLSKLVALALFASIFIVASQLAMLPLFLRISFGRWAEPGLPQRLLAHLAASVAASAFVVLAVTAMTGILLLTVPRRRLQAASTVFRSLMLCALVLSLPLAARLLAVGPRVVTASRLMFLVPPVWFVGVQQVLLGHATPYFWRLTQIAAASFVAALGLAVAGYSRLYRRFDRVMMRPSQSSAGGRLRSAPLPGWIGSRRPSFAAVTAFTHLTLARSGLHQGVFVAIAACGAGLVLNSFIGAHAVPRFQTYEQALASTAIWAPFALIFSTTLAVRTALLLPIDSRANWVFRVTEDDAARVEQLKAVIHAMVSLGVVAPLAILVPVEWAMFGTQAIVCTSVALLAGLVLVELEMGEWRRIPFTCSYMPGKRFVGLTALVGFAAFVVFTSIGSGLVYYSRGHRIGWLVVMTILSSVVWQRRRRRARLTRHTPLVFEDLLPNEIEPLRLSAY